MTLLLTRDEVSPAVTETSGRRSRWMIVAAGMFVAANMAVAVAAPAPKSCAGHGAGRGNAICLAHAAHGTR